LTFQPDTTSGGSYRQDQQAGNTTLPTRESKQREINKHDRKISSRPRE
jgi:hypothetical protein